MRLKTIIARNIPEGMRRVREQLGDDAVIVQTEETDTGVLIMAAVETMHSLPPHHDIGTGDEGVPWNELPCDPAETVSEALDFHRVPGPIVSQLLAAPETWDLDDAAQAFAGALQSRFAFDDAWLRKAARPLLLIGPPGGGKTITAAKLATAAVMGGLKPSLICADTERAGGAEQLETFATALKLDMIRALPGAELTGAVTRAGANRPVIIDGPALNPLESADARLMHELAASARADLLLVIPAGLDAAEAEDIALACKEIGASRFIATRLDASRRLGALLSTAAAGLAFTVFGVSRKIVDGLRPADPEGLARALLSASPGKPAVPTQIHLSQAIG